MLSAFAKKNHKIQRQSLPKGRWACKGRPWKSNSQGTFPLLVMPLLNRPFRGIFNRDFPNGWARQWSVCSRPWKKNSYEIHRWPPGVLSEQDAELLAVTRVQVGFFMPLRKDLGPS